MRIWLHKGAALRLAVVITASLGSTPAWPAFKTGNDILTHCTEQNLAETRRCWGYLEGVADAMVIHDVNGFTACFSVGVDSDQLKDIVLQYLRANPATRHYVAADIVARALAQAFPCQ
jgi:hypothetical protein